MAQPMRIAKTKEKIIDFEPNSKIRAYRFFGSLLETSFHRSSGHKEYFHIGVVSTIFVDREPFNEP